MNVIRYLLRQVWMVFSTIYHQPQSRLMRFFLATWKNQLTATGRMTLLVVCIAGPVSASITISHPMYIFALLLFSMLIVSRVIGWGMRPKLSVTRLLPERCPLGATLTVQATIRNTGRKTGYDLCVTERDLPDGLEGDQRPTYLACLAPNAEERTHYTLTPTKRGAYSLKGPVALTSFPFGLHHHARAESAPHELLVYPRFTHLRRIQLPAGRKYQPGGLQLTSQVGDSEEFIGNREYRPGDRLRDLDHRAWARVGGPVVREFQQEYLSRIALIVDTHVPRGDRAADEALEAALSLAASIADVLSRQEYVVDIFAAGPDLYHFQAGRSLAYLENILDILACIQSCPHSPFGTLGPALMEEILEISTAVVIMLDWNEERDRFVRQIRDQGVAVRLLIIREASPTQDPAGFVSDAGPATLLTPTQIHEGVDAL